ncbi:MAG: hypothetical protein ABL982_11685, partial [Vicinamibacterales bacterium]
MRSRLVGIGVAAAALSTTVVATSVGPVAGYKATDATSYSFVDVAAAGGASVLTSTDDGVAALTLPFAFTFFGNAYSTLCVSSNGAGYFTNAPACIPVADFVNTDVSSTAPPGDQPSVFPLWSDLVLAGPGSGVFYQAQGVPGSRKFIVQWNNAYPLSKDTGVSPNAMTFEMILFEGNNQILFQYRTTDLGAANQASKGAQATIGIRDAGSVELPPQVPTGNGNQIGWSHRSPVVGDGTAILFTAGKSTPVVTAAGGSFVYTGQPQGGTGQAYGASAETLTPVVLSYEGTGDTVYGPTPLAPTDAGSYKVTAAFGGNSDYQSGSEDAFLTITRAAQPTVQVTGPLSATYGTPGQATASGGAGGGAYVFSAGGTGCTVNGTSVSVVDASGNCELTATRAGDANHLPSDPSDSFTVTLSKATQTAVTVTALADLTYGVAGTAIATGGNAGVYSFDASGSTGCSVAGNQVTVTNATGSCAITATRSGDNNYLPSAPSVPRDVTLQKAPQQIDISSAPSQDPSVGGAAYHVTAAGGASGNPVLFSSLTPGVCTLSGGNVVSFLSAGDCQIAANQAGNDNYEDAAQAVQHVTVGNGVQAAVTVKGPAAITFGATLTATAEGGSGTGSFNFSHGTSTGCTVTTSGTLSVTNASLPCALTATRLGDANYLD